MKLLIWSDEDILIAYILLTIVMISPRTSSLKHLKLHQSVPINTICSSLNFSEDANIPPNSSKQILISLSNRHIYFGKILNNKAEDSQCKFIFADGTIYEGQCKEGKFEGKGSLTKYGQDFEGKLFSYEGNWHLSKPHGQGREQISNSMIYEGTFVAGQKSGKGVMLYVDGNRYEGEFLNNQVEGKGVYKTKTHQWEGTWNHGYLQGSGTQISFGQSSNDEEDEEQFNGQSIYKGGFQRGLKHGEGTYTWGKNFSEYSGNFENGQLDGEGRFKLGETEYRGKWKKGVQLSLESTIQFKRVSKKLQIDIPDKNDK